jgi:hypothetical protein
MEKTSVKFRMFLEYIEKHDPTMRGHRAYGWMSSELLAEIESLEKPGETCPRCGEEYSGNCGPCSTGLCQA